MLSQLYNILVIVNLDTGVHKPNFRQISVRFQVIPLRFAHYDKHIKSAKVYIQELRFNQKEYNRKSMTFLALKKDFSRLCCILYE